ncbi:MAG: hypothetical protein ACLR7Z_13690 [Bilophila wadsworthia]
MLVMVGTSNAVNLTDGLDGLAIGPMVVAGLVFSVYIYITGHVRFAQYLQLEYISGWARSLFSAVRWLARGLGSLWFNAYPAQMFMGDVGRSGSAACWPSRGALQETAPAHRGRPVRGGNPLVILQVSYFKASGGKRIFRMALAAPSL